MQMFSVQCHVAPVSAQDLWHVPVLVVTQKKGHPMQNIVTRAAVHH